MEGACLPKSGKGVTGKEFKSLPDAVREISLRLPHSRGKRKRFAAKKGQRVRENPAARQAFG